MTTVLPDRAIGGSPQFAYSFHQLNADGSQGALADPSSLVFTIASEDNSVVLRYTYGVDAELVRDSEGQYHVYVTLTVAGVWEGRWIPSGNGTEPTDFKLGVTGSRLYP